MTKIKEFAIDLNLDAGESEQDLASGKEEALYQLVSSVNIACGGHAGNVDTMERSVDLATKYGLAIGAHPSYPDREGFGRRKIQIEPTELIESIHRQMASLSEICRNKGVRLHHVKPHGALYNTAAIDADVSRILIDAISTFDRGLIVVGLAGSVFLEQCRNQGLRCAAEGFVDRRYERDGTLRARTYPDAHVTEPEAAAEQALRFATGEEIVSVDGSRLKLGIETLCIHGDRKDARVIAKAVRSLLEEKGIRVRSLAR
jgi:5-oxoprolinase (ATP-hydrolysing) subunit A